MRYITWKLVWPDDGHYGIGPESVARENGVVIEASSFSSPSVENGVVLGYLLTDSDLSFLSDWEVQEITQAEALAFAQATNAQAFIAEGGRLGFPSLYALPETVEQ